MMVPARVEYNTLDYRDRNCAPKVVFKKLQNNEIFVQLCNKMYEDVLKNMELTVSKPTEPVTEDKDEEDIDVYNHIDDSVIRNILDNVEKEGYAIKIEKSGDEISFGIE